MKKGFTLIEIVVALAILAMLMLASIVILEPAEMINRANDATRKKDLGRIKIAFEEYANDKDCYPTQDVIDSLVCGQSFFGYLNSWPCDPDKSKYKIFAENSSCPKYFRVVTNLKNKNDPAIPKDWLVVPIPTIKYGDVILTRNDVNYGVSSSNISWNDAASNSVCTNRNNGCFIAPPEGGCNTVPNDQNYYNAYTDPTCSAQCFVSCCHNGNVCN